MAASARLTRLKKVRKKARLKEWRLAEQGLCKLRLEEAKKDSNQEEAETTRTPVVDPLDFSSFSILPKSFSSDTPVPFP
jgi:hypothetical protein